MMQTCSIPVGEAADSTHPLLCWDIYVLPLAHLNIKLQQLYRKKKKKNTKTMRQKSGVTQAMD